MNKILDNKKISVYRNGFWCSGFYIEKSYIEISNYLKETNYDLKKDEFDDVFSTNTYKLEQLGFEVKDCANNPFNKTECFQYYFTEDKENEDYVYVLNISNQNKLEVGIHIDEKLADEESIASINKRLCKYLDLKEIVYEIFNDRYGKNSEGIEE